MRLPVIEGLIRRRILVNFRVAPDVVRQLLPSPLRPKLHAGHAIAGICLIRLEQIRPKGFPRIVGFSSENAAHRIAVEWDDLVGNTSEGVYIPRRDTSSLLNHVAGGRLFPGEHRYSSFGVRDDGLSVSFTIRSSDGGMSLELRGRAAQEFPGDSCFGSVQESSAFCEKGSVGFSATTDCCRLDGIELRMNKWEVAPLAVERVDSSYFADLRLFPAGSATFDHALIMRDIPHQWRSVSEMRVEPREILAK
jgi:hypothetical protein